MQLRSAFLAAAMLAGLHAIPVVAGAYDVFPLKVADQIVGPVWDCDHSSAEFVSGGPAPKIAYSAKLSLPQGTYRPVLNGTQWRFSKGAEWGNFDAF